MGEPILIPVQYRGQALWMALDLGSPFSLVWPSAVEPLHLRTQTLEAQPGEFLLAVQAARELRQMIEVKSTPLS